MPVSLVVAVLNIILFFLGLYTFGKGFAMSILISTFVFPFFLEFFGRIRILHGYLDDSLLAMVIGGALVGIGIGIVIKAGASTGGVDILAQFIHKKFHLPVHRVLNVIDVLISVFQITIISDFYEKIRTTILDDIDAGVTMMLSEKGYTRQDLKLITTVIPYHKLPKIKERVKEIDPMAFIIVAKIEEVGGQGFTLERQT